MRSSNKSRSRKNNNRRGGNAGNVVNRVFDSSGPEGKVRGTPQQIIDKYQQLARDAGLSGDRIAQENFLQHSEHYARMLSAAMRELADRKEQQEKREAQQKQSKQNGQEAQKPEKEATEVTKEKEQLGEPIEANATIEPNDEADSGLVDTPETIEDQPESVA